jgi:hypothetical protein
MKGRSVLAVIAVGAGIAIGALLPSQPLAQFADWHEKISVKAHAVADYGRHDTSIARTAKLVVSVEYAVAQRRRRAG